MAARPTKKTGKTAESGKTKRHMGDLPPKADQETQIKGGSPPKSGGIDGESTDKDHKDWIII